MTTEATALAPAAVQLVPADHAPVSIAPAQGGAFSSIQAFESACRMAKPLAASNLVPTVYQDNLGDCIIALEMAQRMGANPLSVMQNLHIIHGRPSWSSAFVIAAINTCGRFEPLRFEIEGEGEDLGCVAWTRDKRDGERRDSPRITMAMAKAEGWISRKGSKWQTMPELMLRYRSAAFFGRLYAPEILMGMQTMEEVVDVSDAGPQAANAPPTDSITSSLNDELSATTTKAEPDVVDTNTPATPADDATADAGAEEAQGSTDAAPATDAEPAGEETPKDDDTPAEEPPPVTSAGLVARVQKLVQSPGGDPAGTLDEIQDAANSLKRGKQSVIEAIWDARETLGLHPED